MKFCVDCKHHKYEHYHHVCQVSGSGEFDPVTGARINSFTEQCFIQRRVGEQCGREGELFEPKEPEVQQGIWQNIKTFFRKETH